MVEHGKGETDIPAQKVGFAVLNRIGRVEHSEKVTPEQNLENEGVRTYRGWRGNCQGKGPEAELGLVCSRNRQESLWPEWLQERVIGVIKGNTGGPGETLKVFQTVSFDSK